MPETPGDQLPKSPAEEIPAEVTLLREIQKRRSILNPLGNDEREFLVTLSGYINTQGWDTMAYDKFAQLFRDYIFCLDVIGPAARQLGLRVSIALNLFSNHIPAFERGGLQEHLAEILRLNPYSRP
jgi:hypothetical protein